MLVLGRELAERRFRAANPVPHKGQPGHKPFRTKAEGQARRRADAANGEVSTVLTRKVLTGTGGLAYTWPGGWPEIEKLIGTVNCGALAKLWYEGLAITGARPSELSGARWVDVDLEHDNLHIIHPVPELNGKRYWRGQDVNDPDAPQHDDANQMKRRGDHGRIVPINDEIENWIARLVRFERPGDPVGWLFPGRLTAKARESVFGSLPMGYEWTQQLLRKATRGTRYEGMTQYDLRHYYASERIAEGASAEQVAQLMGTSPHLVMSTYAPLMKGSTR